MTNQFIHEEISMLFCSEKFYGWVGGGGGDIAIIATSCRSRSLIRDLRWTLDLDRAWQQTQNEGEHFGVELKQRFRCQEFWCRKMGDDVRSGNGWWWSGGWKVCLYFQLSFSVTKAILHSPISIQHPQHHPYHHLHNYLHHPHKHPSPLFSSPPPPISPPYNHSRF